MHVCIWYLYVRAFALIYEEMMTDQLKLKFMGVSHGTTYVLESNLGYSAKAVYVLNH